MTGQKERRQTQAQLSNSKVLHINEVFRRSVPVRLADAICIHRWKETAPSAGRSNGDNITENSGGTSISIVHIVVYSSPGFIPANTLLFMDHYH